MSQDSGFEYTSVNLRTHADFLQAQEMILNQGWELRGIPLVLQLRKPKPPKVQQYKKTRVLLTGDDGSPEFDCWLRLDDDGKPRWTPELSPLMENDAMLELARFVNIDAKECDRQWLTNGANHIWIPDLQAHDNVHMIPQRLAIDGEMRFVYDLTDLCWQWMEPEEEAFDDQAGPEPTFRKSIVVLPNEDPSKDRAFQCYFNEQHPLDDKLTPYFSFDQLKSMMDEDNKSVPGSWTFFGLDPAFTGVTPIISIPSKGYNVDGKYKALYDMSPLGWTWREWDANKY